MTGQVEILVLRFGHADALMQLYERLGYHFARTDGAQLVGLVDL
jgi:hypothetical protein